mgnify:CR=1 FL=1|tara:strand:+ start:29736 stop:30227 length:492 start_codon:yes stop_codon:yes gene_type:complete
MKLIRASLQGLSVIILLIAHIILITVCLKTLLFDYYDPRDGIITYVNIIGVSGLLIIIRWLIKPEFKHIHKRSTDFGTLCGSCFQSAHSCKCWNDDVTEEQFNEAVKLSAFCNNNKCAEQHFIGAKVRYDKNYNVYCDNNECSEGVATIGSTILEECWWNPHA